MTYHQDDGDTSKLAVETFEVAPSSLNSFDGLDVSQFRDLEKKLVRKMDFHLIPALFFLFIFNILDRSNLANARLGSLQKDLDVDDTQYQTANAVLFVGYLLGQIPSNIILTRVRPSRYMPACIFIWGSISLCTTAVQSFGGLVTIRILLGFAESPFFPGALLLLSSWYKPSELAPRVALIYCGNTIANGFGGLLAAGVLSGLDGASGLAGWRWLYVIEGAGTMAAGILAYWLLPDFPMSTKAKWLSEQEQRFAEWRLARDTNEEVDENGGIKQGIKNAVTDIKTWVLVLTQSIVKTLGFNSTITLLIAVPVYIFGFITSLANSYIAMKSGRRAILLIWPMMIDIAGNVMVISSNSTAVRYTGMFLMCAGSYSAFNVVWAWVVSTIPRTRTKRAVVLALVNLFGNSSNIYGSYFFPSKDAPQYRTGGVILSSFAAGGILCASGLALYLHKLNKAAERKEAVDGIPPYRYTY